MSRHGTVPQPRSPWACPDGTGGRLAQSLRQQRARHEGRGDSGSLPGRDERCFDTSDDDAVFPKGTEERRHDRASIRIVNGPRGRSVIRASKLAAAPVDINLQRCARVASMITPRSRRMTRRCTTGVRRRRRKKTPLGVSEAPGGIRSLSDGMAHGLFYLSVRSSAEQRRPGQRPRRVYDLHSPLGCGTRTDVDQAPLTWT